MVANRYIVHTFCLLRQILYNNLATIQQIMCSLKSQLDSLIERGILWMLHHTSQSSGRLTCQRERRFEIRWLNKPHNTHTEFDLWPAKPLLKYQLHTAKNQPWWNWQREREITASYQFCPPTWRHRQTGESFLLSKPGWPGEGQSRSVDDSVPETDVVSLTHTNTPVHTCSCAGWCGFLSWYCWWPQKLEGHTEDAQTPEIHRCGTSENLPK